MEGKSKTREATCTDNAVLEALAAVFMLLSTSMATQMAEATVAPPALKTLLVQLSEQPRLVAERIINTFETLVKDLGCPEGSLESLEEMKGLLEALQLKRAEMEKLR